VTFAARLALGLVLAALVSTPGCSGCAGYRRCSAPEPAALAALPTLLSQTGLFAAGPDQIAPEVIPYEPAFALWSDGAAKRRWVALPRGSRIDTTEPDSWVFPVGTKFWKEFARDGRRIETRLLIKHGPAPRDWAGAAYVWNDAQRDARLAPDGLKNAAGSGHDVPSAADCAGCHAGRRSHVLGFSALQLAAAELPLSLDDLVRDGRLTRPPERPPSIPGSELDRAALGYLHANCGHCHNRERPPRGQGPRCYDPERSIDFWLPSAAGGGDVRQTPALRSSVPRFLTPGAPDESRLITLVSRRGWRLHMPPLASREVDVEGVRLLRRWIESLSPSSPEPADAATLRGRGAPGAATP
jgi:hypothetical protein